MILFTSSSFLQNKLFHLKNMNFQVLSLHSVCVISIRYVICNYQISFYMDNIACLLAMQFLRSKTHLGLIFFIVFV